MGRQWLGRLGKTDNGIVTVTTVWTDGRVYYPLHATPYTPAHHFSRGRSDPAFRTKPQLSAALAARGKAADFGCRAVVADCAYSVSDHWYLALREAGLAYVVALKPHRGTWAPADQPHTSIEAAHALKWRDAKHPGDWTPVERHFHGGHTETWWAADARLAGYGSRLTLPTGRSHHRPGQPAGEGHLVPRHQPAPPCYTPRRGRSAPAGRPRRDRPPLRPAALDRAELQTDQGRTRLGRLPSPFRPRHPPTQDPGQLRLLLLLGPMVHPTRTSGCHRAAPLSTGGARERDQTYPTRPNSPAGPGPYAPSGAGSPRPSPLTRWWRAWTDTDPPHELQALIDAVTTGHGIDLYVRI
ncbi:transposase [Streptomyces sp. NPDC006703]|uniref:transposase n=1 Tax=Streptomyces sp. NPDC006703 TaxID=3364759 RepID=UPI0036C1C542